MEERLYTLQEFLEAEVDASVSVQWAAMGFSDEQAAKDIAELKAQLAKDSLLMGNDYVDNLPRRTWTGWVQFMEED